MGELKKVSAFGERGNERLRCRSSGSSIDSYEAFGSFLLSRSGKLSVSCLSSGYSSLKGNLPPLSREMIPFRASERSYASICSFGIAKESS
jgi:hypothetical protein